MDLGGRAVGLTKIQWDGRNNAGDVMPAGTYQISVQAANAQGAAVSVSQEATGQIMGVSFDKGYPVLTLDSGVSVPVSDLLKVAGPPIPTATK
jgi:flagellar basal-body rod modification protein FlgD